MKTRWTVKKGLCRFYQYVMKVGMCLLPWRMPNRLIGPGTVEKLPAAIKRRNYRKILVVTDKDLSALRLPDGMLAALDKEGLQWKPIPIICITADWKVICGICPRHRAYFKRSL